MHSCVTMIKAAYLSCIFFQTNLVFPFHMKKTLIALAVLAGSLTAVQAQESGEKLAKSAGKALTSYNIDPANNAAKLEEAKNKINEALQFPDAQAMASAWLTKGDIYNTLVTRDMQMKQINQAAKITGDNDALVAFEAYKMAFNSADAKKYHKSDAIKGIGDVQGYMINIGINKYEATDYAKAYDAFNGSIIAHDMLKAAGKKSVLDEGDQYDNQLYITALAASLANKNDVAIPLYEQLYKKGTDKPEVYSGIYKAKLSAKDTAAAEMILKEGRQKFPEDATLLFDEINSYLVKGKLSELTTSLKSAIAKEPNNVGLYVTLGNVYDNLYQRELTAKNDAKAKENFDQALQYYTEAAKVDPKNADAVYATGALYYNKAALLTQELNALPEDFSAAGMKKYNDLKSKIGDLFNTALPYFKKAESLDPNDQNTLIALSEIFARQDELELMKEFKTRLEKVRGGGKNDAPYFKN